MVDNQSVVSSDAGTAGDVAALNSEISKISGADDSIRVPVFGFSTQDFKLPCGYVDENGGVHDTVVLQQMTGVEEEMMANDNLVVTERITNILASCCKKLGMVTDPRVIRAAIEDNDDLPALEEPQGDGGKTTVVRRALPLTAADRMAMLLFLRITSIGKVYRFNSVCPYCDKENKDEALNLDELEIKYVKDPTKRLARIRLPRSGVEVVLKILTGKGESSVAKLASNPKNARTLALIARIESVNGTPLPPANFGGIKLVKQMPYEDRLYLRRVFDLMEGSIDSEIEVVCKKATCARAYKFSLDLGQVFFLPPKATVSQESIEWM